MTGHDALLSPRRQPGRGLWRPDDETLHGEHHESTLPGGEGLYFYNARWYNAKLGRFLSALLTGNGTPPVRVTTTATVHLEAGPTITRIDLVCEADVEGVTAERFAELAAEAKAKCPISKALAAVETVTLDARLV